MNGPRRDSGLSRRELLASGALAAAAPLIIGGRAAGGPDQTPVKRKGNIHHSACKWCYRMPLEKLAQACVRLGMPAIDLLGPRDFPLLKKHGLVCSMTGSHGINPGLNRKEHHPRCLKAIRDAIEATAAAGFPNVICFSGNRRGLPDDEGLKNCAEGLKQVVGLAEQKNVTLNMEILNSKVNHKDYQCDLSRWAFDLVDAVASPRFKILYDIYHVQIMEGDIIRTIAKHIDKIGHFHTGGNPGRHDIDETQELYYPAIMQAIVKAGFKGYVAQEFLPRRGLDSLAKAIDTCDV